MYSVEWQSDSTVKSATIWPRKGVTTLQLKLNSNTVHSGTVPYITFVAAASMLQELQMHANDKKRLHLQTTESLHNTAVSLSSPAAAARALLRVAAAESPTNIYSTSVATKETINTHFKSTHGGDCHAFGVAAQGGVNLTPRILPRMQYQSPSKAIIPNSVLSAIISGGMGGLGLLSAGWLTRNGTTKLVLLGRSGRVATSPQLENLLGGVGDAPKIGAASQRVTVEVVLLRCDVTCPVEVAAALRECNADLVCHAGGLLEVPISDSTPCTPLSPRVL